MSIEDSVMKTRTQRIGLLLVKYQRKFLFFGGLLFVALGLSLGVTVHGYGGSMYTMGIWWASTGLFLGIRRRYIAVMMGIGIVLALGFWYGSPALLAGAGVGIFVGSFSLLLDNIGKSKKIRLSVPKPSFMAITLVGILALGMMSPLGLKIGTSGPAAKLRITFADGKMIVETRPEDQDSFYDVLIQDERSAVAYKVTVDGNDARIVVDDKEYSFTLAKPNLPENESTLATTSTEPTFYWDRIFFVNRTPTTVKYPHPDRVSYYISQWASWSMYGRKLLHYQFDQATSLSVSIGGATAIGGLIGAVIGYLVAPPEGAIYGALIGAVVLTILTWFRVAVWLDESDCLWWWAAKNWLRWLYDFSVPLIALWIFYPPGAIASVLASFCGLGYLRVGDMTFGDCIAMGNPGDPETPCPAVVMWWYDYYITKPGTLQCLYNASKEYEGLPGEYLESHVGPADAWPDREHAHPVR